MANLTIRDILLLQQADLAKVIDGAGIRREVMLSGASRPPITVISGPRRAGKTTAAIRFLSGIDAGTFGYIDLADERLGGVADHTTIIAAIDSVYGNEDAVLLDGIPHLPAWENLVDRLAGEGRRVVITGSCRNFFGPDAKARFVGRYRQVLLLPLSFGEYLAMAPDKRTVQEKSAALQQYAESGGFFEPLIRNIPGREYLPALFDSVVYRDIVKRHNIRSVQGIGVLSLYLLSAIATEQSFASLARATRCKSTMTVRSHLGYLEDAFLFFSIPRYSNAVRERAPANRKIYCTDTGFVTARGFGARENRGRLYENLVAIGLWKRQQQSGEAANYWKNVAGEAVDFVVRNGYRVTALIQICADGCEGKIRSRKIRALLKASRELQCENLLLLSEEDEKSETAEWFGMKGTVRYVPLWKWLEAMETGTIRQETPGTPGSVQ